MGSSQKRFEERPRRVAAFDGSGAKTRRRLGECDEMLDSSTCKGSSVGAMRTSCQPFAVF